MYSSGCTGSVTDGSDRAWRSRGLEDEFDVSESLPRLLYIKAPAPDGEPGLAGLITRIEQEAAGSYRVLPQTGPRRQGWPGRR